MLIEISSAEEMHDLGARIAALLSGGEVIELVGDIGAGKTTFTKGLAAALGVEDDVQSPTFTISRVYETKRDMVLAHYDFYRIQDPGVLRAELAEAVQSPDTVTIIEWGAVVNDILPADTIRITIDVTFEDTRKILITAGGPESEKSLRELA